jgi:hypothetical protein
MDLLSLRFRIHRGLLFQTESVLVPRRYGAFLATASSD